MVQAGASVGASVGGGCGLWSICNLKFGYGQKSTPSHTLIAPPSTMTGHIFHVVVSKDKVK